MAGRHDRSESLSGRLSRIVSPLSALVALILALGAPAAWFLLNISELQSRAALASRHIAREMQSFVEESPDLWMYNSPKVGGYFKAEYEGEAPFFVEVFDGAGRAAYRADPEVPPYVWETARIPSRSGEGGMVVVGLSARRLLVTGLLLLCLFTALGFGLAGLLYVLPLRSLRRAESRLNETLSELHEAHLQLERANADLERRVEEKTRGLAQARDQLANQQAQLRHLAASSFAAQEEERHRISRDLHDSVGQVLTAIRLNLERGGLLLDAAPDANDRLVDLMEHTATLVDAATESIRQSIHALGEPLLQEGGLAQAATTLVARFEHADCPVALETDQLPADMPESVQVCAVRVLQESLTNALRHANPGAVRVHLGVRGAYLSIRVTDDGRWDHHEDRTGGMGLTSMKDRVSLLGGRIHVKPGPGSGTVVDALLPLRPNRTNPEPAETEEERGD